MSKPTPPSTNPATTAQGTGTTSSTSDGPRQLSQNTKRKLGEKVVAAYFRSEQAKAQPLRKSLYTTPTQLAPVPEKLHCQTKSGNFPSKQSPHSEAHPPEPARRHTVLSTKGPTLPLRVPRPVKDASLGPWSKLLDPNQSWRSIESEEEDDAVPGGLVIALAKPPANEDALKKQTFEHQKLKHIQRIQKDKVGNDPRQDREATRPHPTPASRRVTGLSKGTPVVTILKDPLPSKKEIEEDSIPGNVLPSFPSLELPSDQTLPTATVKRQLRPSRPSRPAFRPVNPDSHPNGGTGDPVRLRKQGPVVRPG